MTDDAGDGDEQSGDAERPLRPGEVLLIRVALVVMLLFALVPGIFFGSWVTAIPLVLIGVLSYRSIPAMHVDQVLGRTPPSDEE